MNYFLLFIFLNFSNIFCMFKGQNNKKAQYTNYLNLKNKKMSKAEIENCVSRLYPKNNFNSKKKDQNIVFLEDEIELVNKKFEERKSNNKKFKAKFHDPKLRFLMAGCDMSSKKKNVSLSGDYKEIVYCNDILAYENEKWRFRSLDLSGVSRKLILEDPDDLLNFYDLCYEKCRFF